MMNLKNLERVAELQKALQQVHYRQACLADASRLDIEDGNAEEVVRGYRNGATERNRHIFAALENTASKLLAEDETEILATLAELGVTVDPKPKTDPS